MKEVRLGAAPSEQRDQECHQSDRNGDHERKHDEAAPTGNEFFELPLATALGRDLRTVPNGTPPKGASALVFEHRIRIERPPLPPLPIRVQLEDREMQMRRVRRRIA
jgi:hypothetical protein